MVSMAQTTRQKPLAIGGIGRTVVHNIADLIQARNLSLRKLSARLEQLDRPILPSALHALSQGARRTDVDDLVALAIALEVNPNALLFPRHVSPDFMVELTPGWSHPAGAVWRWASGEMPLPGARQSRADFAAHSGLSVTAGGTGHEVLQEIRNLAARTEDLLADLGNPATFEPREHVLLIALERAALEVRELTHQARLIAAERSKPEVIPQESGVPLVRGPLRPQNGRAGALPPVADPFGQRSDR